MALFSRATAVRQARPQAASRALRDHVRNTPSSGCVVGNVFTDSLLRFTGDSCSFTVRCTLRGRSGSAMESALPCGRYYTLTAYQANLRQATPAVPSGAGGEKTAGGRRRCRSRVKSGIPGSSPRSSGSTESNPGYSTLISFCRPRTAPSIRGDALFFRGRRPGVAIFWTRLDYFFHRLDYFFKAMG